MENKMNIYYIRNQKQVMEMSMEAIYPKELDGYINDGRIMIIDLRDREEYKEKHIKGAYNIPYETNAVKLFQLTKARTYILYCERGTTSFKAAREMSNKGYKVMSLMNGISMYKGKYLVVKNEKYY